MADKLRKLLFALETAETLDQLGRFPGWRPHPLKGDMTRFWSLTVMNHLLRMQLAYDVANTRRHARDIAVKRYVPA